MSANNQYPPLAKLRHAKRLLIPENPLPPQVSRERCTYAGNLIAEALSELEQPQETEASEAAKQPEVPPDHHVCFTRAGLVRWSPGLTEDCIWCPTNPPTVTLEPSERQRFESIMASRRRRLPTVCTCANVGGFSARCKYHGHRVDRTPIGC